MSRNYRPFRSAPPWWPEDEPWPPQGRHDPGWRYVRKRFRRRIGIVFGLFIFLAIASGTLLFWLAATSAGLIIEPAVHLLSWRVPAGVALFVLLMALLFSLRALRGAAMPVGDLLEALPHIFERFYKSGDSSGSGLGLAIARYIVLAHGGDISAESTPGAGTTIRLSLPLVS